MSAISHYGATTAYSQVSSLDVIFVAVLYYFGHWPQKVESFKKIGKYEVHAQSPLKEIQVYSLRLMVPLTSKFPLATNISEYSQHVVLERSLCQALAQHGSSNLHIT